MREALRRLYNSIDGLFDRRAITEARRFSLPSGDTTRPQTARYAFDRIHPLALEHDPGARLKLIVSAQGAGGIDEAGRSSDWDFFFDLPRGRAHLNLNWFLPWNEARDGYDPARIRVALKPFPAPDSLIHRMVQEGKLLNRNAAGLWKEEMARTAYLPVVFRDSYLAVADFMEQGLDVALDEFTMTTGRSPEGRPVWIGQARRKTYIAPFES